MHCCITTHVLIIYSCFVEKNDQAPEVAGLLKKQKLPVDLLQELVEKKLLTNNKLKQILKKYNVPQIKKLSFLLQQIRQSNYEDLIVDMLSNN